MANPRKVEIRLSRNHKRFSFNGRQGQFKVTVVWLLLGDVCVLPSLQHNQHVLRVYSGQCGFLPASDGTSNARTLGARPFLPEVDHEVF